MIPLVRNFCHTTLYLSRKQALQSALRCTSHSRWTSSEQQSSHSKYFHGNNRLLFLLAAGGIGAISSHWLFFRKTLFAKEEVKSLTDVPSKYGTRKGNLPTYSFEEVSKHDSKEKRIWITFREGVYDITDFIDKHPGGTQILMAAGASVDPFWDLYAVHKTNNVLDLLESYRIGNLNPEDRDTSSTATDNWADQPRRHLLLTPRSEKPYNAEPPPSLLVENLITPNALFFVRNHLPVPRVDEKTYCLKIEGLGIKEDISLSLNDLRTKFPHHSVTTTIQCAGNRRSEMNRVKQVRGLEWGKAAISTATWTGVRLVDLLKLSGVDSNHPHLKHIQFEGLDSDPVQGTAYGASVPVERVLDPKTETLIAFEMNGQPLPRDHGFPVRVIIPGIVGARQVKWLGKIILSDQESNSHWQQKDYKGFSPSTDADSAKWEQSPAIQDSPVQSAICVPEEGAEVKVDSDGCIAVKGYAWSGGGRAIIRVDVSSDGGKTWSVATLNPHPKSLYYAWAWTLWEARVPVSTSQKVEVICKATDSSYSTQPESFEGIYNFRGVLSNAWSRVNVKVTSEK